MKKRLHIAFSILIVLSFLSCRKEINYKIPDNGRKIVVNSFFNTEDTFKVNLSKSLYILDDAQFSFVQNATVKLYEDDNFVENLFYDKSGNYFSNSLKPKAGKNYSLKVLIDNFDEVTASETLPEIVKINSIDTASVMFVPSGGGFGGTEKEEMYEFKINFDDKIGNNYYMIKIQYVDKFGYEGDTTTSVYDLYINYNDIIVEKYISSQGAIIFSDKYFEGSQLNLSLYLSKWNFYNLNTPVIVSLFSLSESYYKYVISFEEQNNSSGNPFAEPVQVYNNINNGYGIFAGYSVDKKIIYIDGQTYVEY